MEDEDNDRKIEQAMKTQQEIIGINLTYTDWMLILDIIDMIKYGTSYRYYQDEYKNSLERLYHQIKSKEQICKVKKRY